MAVRGKTTYRVFRRWFDFFGVLIAGSLSAFIAERDSVLADIAAAGFFKCRQVHIEPSDLSSFVVGSQRLII